MVNLHRLIFGLFMTLSLSACDNSETALEAEKKQLQSTFKTVEWTDLMPKDDLDAILNTPDYIMDVDDGSAEDQLSSQLKNSVDTTADDINKCGSRNGWTGDSNSRFYCADRV